MSSRMLFLGLLILPVTVFAQPASRLQNALVSADNDLRAGHFEEADKKLRKLSVAISEKFGSGPQAMYTVGVIASFRAIAAAGLNNLNEAEWYWNAATSFYPKFAGSDLHVYGPAGQAVMRIDSSHPCDGPAGILSGASAPKPVHHPMPKYPYHAVETGIAEEISIDVTVSEKGELRCPAIVDTHYDPSLAWVMLEAMKDWRFEPARVNGLAVPARYRQYVDFRIRY